jgi:hypothetical protein
MSHPMDYHFSITPYAVNDGQTIPYFLNHGFNTAQLIVPDTGIYQNEINKLKAAGLRVIVDVEQPIWAGGQQKWTPITSFDNYFKQLKSVGVDKISSEGGRDGDLDYFLTIFGKGYMNYNCDLCHLWKDFYKHPATFVNSWECYYVDEWPYIQQGVQESAPLGIKQGILAGMWGDPENPIWHNTIHGGSPDYYSIAAWIDAHGGLDHFAAWGGLNNGMLGRYKDLEFESIVAKLQGNWPANPLSNVPPIIPTPEAKPGPPEATTNADAYIFITGQDSALWAQEFRDGKWSDWYWLGGRVIGVPEQLKLGNSVLVQVVGTDQAVWIRSVTEGKWSGWTSHGGKVKNQ